MERVHPSWHPEAKSVLDRACERHGGWSRWHRLSRVRLVPARLWGLLPAMKGYGRTFRLPESFEIAPHERRVLFHGYSDGARVGVFDDGAVRLEDCATGRTLEASDDHRRTFEGFAKNRRWSPADALYFFGYALAHYHSLPFSRARARVVAQFFAERENREDQRPYFARRRHVACFGSRFRKGTRGRLRSVHEQRVLRDHP
jgi:hypothetical protein